MTVGSAVAAGLAVPLASLLGGWPRSLATWALPAAAALTMWLAITHPTRPRAAVNDSSAGLPWRSRTAWLVAGYLTAQSVLFYSCLAWLAPVYVARGWSQADAGLLLSAFGAAQLAATLAVPAADRLAGRRPLLYAAAGATATGLAGLLTVPDLSPLLLVAVLGAGLGAGFALGLLLLVDHAATPAGSTQMSAMAFLVSYTLAAWGPTLTGVLHDATGGFQAPFAVLLAVSLAQLAHRPSPTPGSQPTTPASTWGQW